MTKYLLKRAYDEPSKSDGYRVLVDRIWPRGVSKQDAKIDEWAKDIAPSTGLRKWFNHDPKKFSEFKKRYKSEIDLEKYRKLWSQHDVVSLIYAAKDKAHNQAVVLAEILSD